MTISLYISWLGVWDGICRVEHSTAPPTILLNVISSNEILSRWQLEGKHMATERSFPVKAKVRWLAEVYHRVSVPTDKQEETFLLQLSSWRRILRSNTGRITFCTYTNYVVGTWIITSSTRIQFQNLLKAFRTYLLPKVKGLSHWHWLHSVWQRWLFILSFSLVMFKSTISMSEAVRLTISLEDWSVKTISA